MEKIVMQLQKQWNDREYVELKGSLQPLIVKMTHSFVKTHPTKYSFREFLSLSDAALYKAIIHFKPDNKTKFSTYFFTILKNEFISFNANYTNVISETDYVEYVENEEDEENDTILENFKVEINYENIFRQLNLQDVYLRVISILKTKKSSDYKVFQKLWASITENGSCTISEIAKEVNVTSTSVLYSIRRIKTILEEEMKKLNINKLGEREQYK